MAREAAEGVTTLAAMHRVRVIDERGHVLGRVYDVRVRYDPKQPGRSAVATALVYGGRGLLETLGVRRERGKTLEWQRVVSVEPDRVAVRATGGRVKRA